MAQTDRPDLLAEVRAEAARQGLSTLVLAHRSGIHPSTLRRRLHGVSPMTLPELVKVCDALGVTLAVLASRAEQVAA